MMLARGTAPTSPQGPVNRATPQGPLSWVKSHGQEELASLVTDIRSFRNADLPALLEIWDQHWSALGPPPHVNRARFEQAVLARIYFDPTTLLVVETELGIQAWCHYIAADESTKTAIIAAFCSSTSCDRAAFEGLLGEVVRQAAERGYERIEAGVVRDSHLGYAGLDPIGHGIAVPPADMRAIAALQACQFQPRDGVKRLLATTSGYRPAVNRDALQFRRGSSVETEDVVFSDPRVASAMSHFDVQTKNLVQRDGQILASLRIWMSDPEAEVMSPSHAIMDIGEAHQEGKLTPAESYLVGAVVQALAVRRIDTVETAVDADKTELLEQFGKLQFRVVGEGCRWERTLS